LRTLDSSLAHCAASGPYKADVQYMFCHEPERCKVSLGTTFLDWKCAYSDRRCMSIIGRTSVSSNIGHDEVQCSYSFSPIFQVTRRQIETLTYNINLSLVWHSTVTGLCILLKCEHMILDPRKCGLSVVPVSKCAAQDVIVAVAKSAVVSLLSIYNYLIYIFLTTFFVLN
jgi:hypothetical protein